MLSEAEERCRSTRAQYWRSLDGEHTFARVVAEIYPPAASSPSAWRAALCSALVATDFVDAAEVDQRVLQAARALATRVRTSEAMSRQFARFLQTPNVDRTDPRPLSDAERRGSASLLPFANGLVENPHLGRARQLELAGSAAARSQRFAERS